MADKIVLLVVEDEPLIAELLKDALTEAGYWPIFADNGLEAMEQLDAPDNEAAGLITDIRLGSVATGWDIARHARELIPSLPVVYMTGDSAADWASQGVPNSVLVSKPFAPAQIITAISQLLNEAVSHLAN